MNNLKSKSELLLNYLRFERGFKIFRKNNIFRQSVSRPARYWIIIITSFISGFIIITIANVYFFWYLNNIESKDDFEIESKYNVQKGEFKGILNDYENKKAKFNNLINNPVNIIEP